MDKEYNIGLDIGTSSVGWAVVNKKDNKIMRKGNKKLWGVRLFSEAVSASERRLFRGNRRRFDRRRKRIKLLNELFSIEINSVDPNFFLKLKESFYSVDDKKNKTITISKDENNMIKDYYKKYPTIYHLRKDLIETKEKVDIRLIYMAIHHIIKYRGNFLYDFENFNINNFDIKDKLKCIFENMYEMIDTLEFSNSIENIDYLELEKALLEKSKNDKKQKVKEVLDGIIPKETVAEICKLVVGNIFSINKLLNIDIESELKVSFKGDSYDEKYSEIENELGDSIEIIELFKELYDTVFLKELFKGENETNISSLMVSKYNKHKSDLKYLKEMFQNNVDDSACLLRKKEYYKIFKNNKKGEAPCLYEKYIHNTISYEEFIKELKKSFDILFSSKYPDEIINHYMNTVNLEMENGTFLPRLADTENGKYPYQLNKSELEQIIENQSKFYPFLKEKTKSDGECKLIRLLKFRIPYYVGPLNSTTSSSETKNVNSWMIKKNDKLVITPYNFEEVVDLNASAENFITRMLKHCTYILDEPTMPANSILYSKFKVLNELKQISIEGRRISKELQNQIYEQLFLKTSGVINESTFKKYLLHQSNSSMYTNFDVSGYSSDKKFANNMQSYIDFFSENGIFYDTNYTEQDAEKIIRWITIFEDKNILKEKILLEYNNLGEKSINMILSKRYKGWSNLSEKLLTNKYYIDNIDGMKKSIIDLMEETDDNFMQIINNKDYKFQTMINEFNKIDGTKKINYEVVKDLAASPATKRGIYQALKIVQELVDYIGYDPLSISIEMARGEETKKRKDNKKDYLSKIYASCKNDISNYNILNKELMSYEKIDSAKLFLYFIQEGKSLYSGKALNISDLELYEIDHIIPQTLIKDDSFDNKALVFRNENQTKAASFILPYEYRTESNRIWWEKLKKNKLISSKKFSNLVRSQYSKNDLDGFINRQLVETRQITKHVANILNSYYKKTKIVYLNAGLSHNYREKHELYKFRSLNDFHHAHDAYLASVLGMYKNSFLKDVDFDLLKKQTREMVEKEKYKDLKYGYVINSLDNYIYNDKTGEIVFNPEEFNNIVENTLYQNDIIVTKKTEIKTGEFYNQTKKIKNSSGVNLKDNLSKKYYGSYGSLNPSYACVIEYIKKDKQQQKMIGIPIYIDAKAKKNINIKFDYIKECIGLNKDDNFIIKKDRIPFYSVLNWEGQICSLVGATSTVEVCNAKEFIIEKKFAIEWKLMLNRVLNKRIILDEKKIPLLSDDVYNKQLDDFLKYLIIKIEKEYKLYDNLVESIKKVSINLSLDDKEILITELLKLLSYGSSSANLNKIGLSSSFGRTKSLNIKKSKILNSSITGIKGHIYEF